MTDSKTFDVVVSDVIFEPSARNSWHSHPGGQILIATAGKGYYQEKGKPIQVLKPGDVIAIAPDVNIGTVRPPTADLHILPSTQRFHWVRPNGMIR